MRIWSGWCSSLQVWKALCGKAMCGGSVNRRHPCDSLSGVLLTSALLCTALCPPFHTFPHLPTGAYACRPPSHHCRLCCVSVEHCLASVSSKKSVHPCSFVPSLLSPHQLPVCRPPSHHSRLCCDLFRETTACILIKKERDTLRRGFRNPPVFSYSGSPAHPCCFYSHSSSRIPSASLPPPSSPLPSVLSV